MGNKIGTAIIGYGYMGQIRRRALENHPDFQLLGIAEPNQKLKPPAETAPWTGNWAELINDETVKAVFVCVPNFLIPEIASACLRKGKHVLCEKPPGRTVEDILQMRAAEEESKGGVLMFGFNHRFHPAMQEAKKIIASNKLGSISWLKGTYGKAGGKNFLQSWRNDRAISGGGILLDQGIHMIDLFRFFARDFEEVKAFCGSSYWDLPVEDNAFVILKNKDGVMAQLHSCAALWKHTFRLEIGLTEGYITIEGFLSRTGSYNRETLTVGYREFEDETRAMGNPREEKYYYDKDFSWDIEISNFAECIKNGTSPQACSSHDALRVMEIIHSVYSNCN